MFVSFMFVFDFMFISFSITWWPSAGKELLSWLAARAVFYYYYLFYAVSVVRVLFPLGIGAACGTRLYRFLPFNLLSKNFQYLC